MEDNNKKKNKPVKPLKVNLMIGIIAMLLCVIFAIIDGTNKLGFFNRDIFSLSSIVGIIVLILFLSLVFCFFFALIKGLIVIRKYPFGSRERTKASEYMDIVNVIPIFILIFLIIDAFILSPVRVSGTSMLDTLNENEKLYINSLVNALLGFPKLNKGEKLEIVGFSILNLDWAAALEARRENKKFDYAGLKACINDFINKRFAITSEDNTLLKKCHCDISNKCLFEMLSTLADVYKWDEKGINRKDLNASKVTQQLFLVALRHEFGFNDVTIIARGIIQG